MIQRMLRYFSDRALPHMTRPSYRREMVTAMAMPVAVALMDMGVVGVVAKKAFLVSDLQLSLIVAMQMFANLTSFGWAWLARGKRKIQFITRVQAVTLVLVATAALLPPTPAGAWMLIGIVLLARCLIAGIVTLRSTVWRHNYPRRVRGQITSRIGLVTFGVLALTPIVMGLAMDANPHSYLVLYPIGALVGLAGVIAYAGVRLRRERELLRFERSAEAWPQRRGENSSVYEYDPHASSSGFWAVLRNDPMYRRYMLLQFIFGTSFMMTEAVVIKLITEMSEPLSRWHLDWLVALTLTTSLPALLAIASIPRWAVLMDRVHISTFRAIHGLGMLGVLAATYAGAAFGSLLLLAVGRTVLGVVRGGGMLAWTLGHNDFADRRLVTAYMGVHVTLTGVRGMLAPFLGMFLYQGSFQIGSRKLAIPGFDGLGPNMFVISLVLAMAATYGFYRMHRTVTGSGQSGRGDEKQA